MRQCIQAWLGSRLGIVIDTTPENFGRHTKDGRILAKLLYSYDVIPLEIYNKIKSSKNVNNCYANLKILKPWLEYLEVPVKDEALYEVASNQSTAALHLFYALYLSLEKKDRLFYLSANKERRFSDDCTARKIRVDWVPERVIKGPVADTETDLALPLIAKQYMIDNHKKKCNEILNTIQYIRENRAKLMADENNLQIEISRKDPCNKLSKQALDADITRQDLQAFENKHLTCPLDLNYQELIDLQNQVNSMPQKPIPNFKEAAGYLNAIKLKSKRGIIIQTFQEDMQALLIDELWDQLKNKQEDHFEEMVCKNLLKQSQYEKQLCTKLALVRHQKDVLIKNRMMIEGLKTSHLLGEFDDCLIYKMEAMAEDAYDDEFETQRILELHKRMYIEKVRLKLEERVREARKILDKLIDIAIRIAEFRELYACEIPKHLMKDLKELFFKDLSIFDIIEEVEELYKVSVCDRDYGEDDRDDLEDEELGEEEAFEGEIEEGFDLLESEECGEREEYDSAKASEYVRQEVLNECDFNDYMFLLGPWLPEILFGDEIEPEVNQIVLGYSVHKVLDCKYPLLTVPIPADIKPMNPRAIVQGISVSDDLSFIMLKELMELLRIFVVRVDDAINFVLKAYKDELSVVRDIDVSLQQATKTTLKGKAGTERTKEPNKKEQLLKKDPSVKKIELLEPDFKDVETQTPRRIPEDDPILSPNAEIGKAAFESLGTGDPVPDCTVISAILALVISVQDDYDGWVLWNYPILYAQASKLECALTGYQLINIEDENDTVEGIEGFECRRNCQEADGHDEYAEKRISRLVPKPQSNKVSPKAESYFSAFIKLRKKGIEPSKSSMQAPARTDHIEKFYDDQKIFYSFEYSALTFQTMKDVGKLILGEVYSSEYSDTELVPKPSVEVFGEGILELNEKFNPPKKKMDRENKKSIDTPKRGRLNVEPSPIFQILEEEVDEGEAVSEEKVDREMKRPSETRSKDLKPGDPDWEWATGPQSEEIQLALANFWESLEAVYIEDFKTIFLCLRVHRSKTIKYKAFLKKSLQGFMKREDDKQQILNDFQLKFNDIDDDLRPDSDIKCELYVRVAELEEVLFQLADDRKEKSEKYRAKFLSNNWIIDEMTHLVNLYLRALQLEADRSIDSCQFINDYYYSLQQKVPPENNLQKFYTPKLFMKDRSLSNMSNVSRSARSTRNSSNAIMAKMSRASLRRKPRLVNDKSGVPPRSVCCGMQNEVIGLPGCVDAINDILVNMAFPLDGSTPFHHFFMDAADDLKNSVNDAIEACIAEAKKGDKGQGLGGAGGGAGKDKKKTAEVKGEVNTQLNAEWTTALENELSRFLYRIRLVQMRGILDFNEFLLAILDTLTSLSEEAEEIYKREVASISDCCKVFRCAIEEETAIQPRLELNIDEFIINQDVLLYPNPSGDLLTAKIPDIQFRFTVEQLSFIFKKLQYIAPDGEIVRRSFLYILEDFRVMKSEDGVPRLLPNIWDDLNPNDLPFIFDHLYQRLEIVNWKDFIIYALELPSPTEVEILNMRSAFRSFDTSNSELISLEDFSKVIFWFESNGNHDPVRTEEVKELLFKMYQVDDNYTNYTAFLLAVCKDEDPILGFVKALSLSLGKKILLEDYSKDLGSEEGEREDIGEDEDSQTQGSGSSKTYGGDQGNQKCHNCTGYACQCKDPISYHSMHDLAEEVGEDYSLYIDSRGSVEAAFTSDIPRDIMKKVFLAAFPAFPQLSLLLRCKASFEQTLDNIFEKLSLDGIHVKVQKLINHKFTHSLLTGTNKFKMIDLLTLIKSRVEETNPHVQSSCSINWN